MKLTIEIGPNARIETNIPECSLHRFIQLIGECTEEGSSFDNSIKIFASPGRMNELAKQVIEGISKKPAPLTIPTERSGPLGIFEGMDDGNSDPLADAIIEAAKERSRRANMAIPNDEDDDDNDNDHTQRVNGSPRYSECAKPFLRRIETLDTWKYIHILEPRSIEDAVLLTAASFSRAFTLPQLRDACLSVFQLMDPNAGYRIPLSDAKVRAVVTDNYYNGLKPMSGSLEPMYEINAKGWRKCTEISQRISESYWQARLHNSEGAELHVVNI